MKAFILLMLVTISGPLLAETNIYRSVDENGNVVFSDEAMPDSEQIKLQDVQTVPADRDVEFKYTPRETNSQEGTYASLEITSPANDTSVRENAGNLTVVIESSPGLLPNHEAVIFLDGVLAANGAQTSFTLQNLDRGSHTITAMIMKGDQIQIESKPVTFTLHRHSVQHPPPANNPPPP